MSAHKMVPVGLHTKKIYTDPKMVISPSDWTSLYIPNIVDGLCVSPAKQKWTLANISNMNFDKRKAFNSEDLQDYIENTLCLGKVRRIDFVETVSTTIQTSAFVHFDWWCYNTTALNLRKALDSCGNYRRHTFYVSSVGTNDHMQCFGFHTMNPPTQRFLMFMINQNPIPDSDSKLNIHQLAAINTSLEQRVQVAEQQAKDAEKRAKDAEQQAKDAEQRIQKLEAQLHDIELRTKIVQFRESEVEKDKQKLEDEFDKKGDELYKQQKALYKESDELDKKGDELYKQQKALYKEGDELYEKQKALYKESDELDARDSALERRDAALDRRDAQLDAYDAALDRRDAQLDARDAALDRRDAQLDACDAALDRRDAQLDAREYALNVRETELNDSKYNFAEQVGSIMTVNELSGDV